MVQPKPLAERSSGYRPGAHHWEALLSCWRAGLRPEPGAEEVFTVLSKFTLLASDPQPTREEVERDIEALETRLGVGLPRSYKDFLRAYQPPLYRPHPVAGGGSLRTGFFAPSQVRRLVELEPQLAEMYATTFAKQRAADENYYRYGADQNGDEVRMPNRPPAIVVGSHGPAYYDLLVLYPMERTADGEMEAGMIMHAGEFRAPSFAELLRQLSVMETAGGHAPPYPQTDLANTCAEKLRLDAIWWR